MKIFAILLHWILSAVAILVTAYILPGVHVSNIEVAFVVAVVLGIVNAVVRPILIVLTFPITIITLGLFMFVVNAFLILLVSYFVHGFVVESFWWSALFSIL